MVVVLVVTGGGGWQPLKDSELPCPFWTFYIRFTYVLMDSDTAGSEDTIDFIGDF